MRSALFDDGRALVLTILLVVVAGIAALLTMPTAEDPRITNRSAVILTPLPGASAERVERLVTQRIEDAMRELPDVDEVSSTSRVGLSSVSVVLRDEVTDSAAAFSEARDALADVVPALPSAAGDPRFVDERGYAFTILAALVWTADEPADPLILRRTALELQSRLRDVPGTDYTDVRGVGDEEVAVTLRGDVAQSLGLSERDVASLLARADAKGTAGQLYAPGAELAVEVRGELDTLDRVRGVTLRAERGGRAQLRLGDVAEVRRQVAEPEAEHAEVGGARAVIVGTRMRDGLRVATFASDVRAALAAFEAELPGGIALETVFDQSSYAGERFTNLGVNLAVGIGLVSAILFVTLGWRAALIVAAAIPLTALGTLAVMNLTGVKLHQMSVTGMIVALGLLVDAAIVVCDAVSRRIARGLSRREAVRETVARFWLPLLSSTATTVLAFMPITLLPGAAGEFVGPIADSVIIALIVSFVLALTVTVALAGRFLPARAASRPPPRALNRVGGAFAGLLSASLARPRLSILAALVLPALGFVGVTTLPSQFFPAADRAQFHVQLRLSPQSSVAATTAAARRADAVLEADDRIASAHWFVGGSVMPFYYNIVPSEDGARGFAEAMVTARDLRGLGPLQNALQADLEAALPDAQVTVRTIVQGPPTPSPIELRITGRDLGTLQRLGEEARLILSEIPEVVATTASVAGGQPKVWVEADEAEARAAGLTLADVSAALAAKLQGAPGGTLIEGEEEVPVIVRLDDAARGALSEVGAIGVSNPAAAGARLAATPVAALGDLALEPSPATITRYQGERVNNVLGTVRAGALPSTAVAKFQDAAAEGRFAMPPGYAYAFGGDDEARSEAVGQLLASVGLIVTMTIAVLVLTFRSFRLAGLVAVVAALSMGLGMLCLTVFRFPFGFQPIIALIGLTGVAINAAIIILSGLQGDPRAVAGDAEAVRDGVLETARHITSTTLTTFAGFLPLILSEGDFWPAFATAIGGGVLLSTVISFFFVPQAFLLLTRRRPAGRPAPEHDADPAAAPAPGGPIHAAA